MPEVLLNTSVAAYVRAYELGGTQLNPENEPYVENIGELPGVRLDVHPHVIERFPNLTNYIVYPGTVLNNVGEGFVKILANSNEELITAAPISNPPSPWDLFFLEDDLS